MPEVIEVELKFPVPCMDRLSERMSKLGVVFGPPHEQVDIYFAHPSRDFWATDEALRIRQDGSMWFLTYKGPRLDRRTKTRRELELPVGSSVADAQTLQHILESLSFRVVARVVKTRRKAKITWRNRSDLCVVWDEVQQLGTFLELELAVPPDEMAAAQMDLVGFAEELSLDVSSCERRSYLELLLAKSSSAEHFGTQGNDPEQQ